MDSDSDESSEDSDEHVSIAKAPPAKIVPASKQVAPHSDSSDSDSGSGDDTDDVKPTAPKKSVDSDSDDSDDDDDDDANDKVRYHYKF